MSFEFTGPLAFGTSWRSYVLRDCTGSDGEYYESWIGVGAKSMKEAELSEID